MSLRTILLANVVALVIGLVSAGALAWASQSSRNLALAFGTLLAAVLLFFIQLRFELRGSQDTQSLSTEFTVDRLKPQIRQWKYPTVGSSRLTLEVQASDWLAGKDAQAFQRDRDKLTKDLALYSLIGFIALEEFDWQLKRVRYSGSTTTVIAVLRSSKDIECTLFTVDQIKTRLGSASNLFAKAPLTMTGEALCLPPRTTLAISSEALVIANPYCRISFTLNPSYSINYTKPGTAEEVPHLASGEAQFETRLIGLDVEIHRFDLYSQHRDAPKYYDWGTRLVQGARLWFEGRE